MNPSIAFLAHLRSLTLNLRTQKIFSLFSSLNEKIKCMNQFVMLISFLYDPREVDYEGGNQLFIKLESID